MGILGRERPKNKWLEDLFGQFKLFGQGFQDRWGEDSNLFSFFFLFLSSVGDWIWTRGRQSLTSPHAAQDQSVIGRAAVAAVEQIQKGKAPSEFWVLEQADIVRL